MPQERHAQGVTAHMNETSAAHKLTGLMQSGMCQPPGMYSAKANIATRSLQYTSEAAPVPQGAFPSERNAMTDCAGSICHNHQAVPMASAQDGFSGSWKTPWYLTPSSSTSVEGVTSVKSSGYPLPATTHDSNGTQAMPVLGKMFTALRASEGHVLSTQQGGQSSIISDVDRHSWEMRAKEAQATLIHSVFCA